MNKYLEKLTAKLKYNSKFNPFRYQFSNDDTETLLKNIPANQKIPDEHLYILNLVIILPLLKSFNDDIIKHLSDYINRINLPADTILEFVLAYSNHFFAKKYFEVLHKPSGNYMYFENLLEAFKTVSKQCEGVIDINNMLVNYINYYNTTGYYKPSEPYNLSLKHLNYLSFAMQVLYTYKAFYETALFEKKQHLRAQR